MTGSGVKATCYAVDIFDCPAFQMFHAEDCPRAQDILVHGSFEPMSMKLWCALVAGASTVVDIGAHVGVYSLAAAAIRPDLPILAFEPNPDVYARLVLHIRLNGFAAIEPHRNGIAHLEGTTKIWWRAKELGHLSSGGHLANDKDGDTFHSSLAVIKPLDAYASRLKSPALIKIDVEGTEKWVFKGARSVLQATPDIVLESFDQAACEYITETTQRLGYRYYEIDEAGMVLRERPHLIAASQKGQNFNQFLSVRDLTILPGIDITS